MSLQYTLDGINDWQGKCFTKPFIIGAENEVNIITTRIIMASMTVDLGTLIEANLGEWMFRLMFASRVAQKENTGISYKDLVNHLGLRTNVVTQTRVAWIKKVTKYAEQEINEHVLAALKHIASQPPQIIVRAQ